MDYFLFHFNQSNLLISKERYIYRTQPRKRPRIRFKVWKKDQEVCEIIDQEQNKGGELPDSCSGKYIFDISNKTARKALGRAWENEKTEKRVETKISIYNV